MQSAGRQASLLFAGALLHLPSSADAVYATDRYKLTFEGFGNLTGAYAANSDVLTDTSGTDGRIDAEARVLGLAKTPYGFSIGPRVTLRGSTDEIDLGEYSLIGTGRWGRAEVGRRRGLPDILTGYGPNAYQFVSAEFGPASGPSLDPDGGLQTALLDPSVGGQINGLTSLGITASLFFDESPKVIYVSPKTHGVLGGISFSPDADDPAGDYDELVQTGLVYEKYWAQNVVRVGGTYAYASARDDHDITFDDLHSISGGTSLTLDDDLTLAASVTYNGSSDLEQRPGVANDSAAFGYAFSVNYNNGPWTIGGFYQAARREGDITRRGNDRLNAFEFGGSYRFTTKIRIYSAVYLYEFDDEGGQQPADSHEGYVFMLGMRLAL